MDFLASMGRIVALFVEVFCVFMTVLFMIGAMMETLYAGIGFILGVAGLVYAYMQREKQDIVDRYFYYIIAFILTYAIAFFSTK